MKKINQSRMTQKEFIEFCQDKDKTYLATQLYQWKQKALINERKLQKVREGFCFLFFDEYDSSYDVFRHFERYFMNVFTAWVCEKEFYRIVRIWIEGVGGVEDE